MQDPKNTRSPELIRKVAIVIRHILGGVLLLVSASALALTMECEPLVERIAKVEFSARGKSEDLTVTWPKTYKDVELIEISVTHERVLIPLDLWPADNNHVEAHLEVMPGHEQFELRASYRVGACVKTNITEIQSWAKRH